MLNPVWLKSLVAIVQTGSFQSAARALGLAQPTVSQHLQKLEEQVGVTLVQRSRSGCQPTTRALAFMPHATALLDMHARALEALHGNRERVGASTNIGTYLLQPFVRNYLTTANERGEVDLRIAANPDVADQLLGASSTPRSWNGGYLTPTSNTASGGSSRWCLSSAPTMRWLKQGA